MTIINTPLRRITIVIGLILCAIIAVSPTAAQDEGVSISIPSIDVNAPIVSVALRQYNNGITTWDVSRLRMTVGHFEGTAWFGDGGNILLGGHSESSRGRADIFFNLDQIQAGAEIVVTVNGTVYRYSVVNVYRVNQDDLTPVYPTTHEQLTLMTCDVGSYNASTGEYQDRIIVVAHRVG